MEYILKELKVLADKYEVVAAKVMETKDVEFIDFHARRLVEMAGNIIVSHLLLQDAQRKPEFYKYAELFMRKAVAENAEKNNYIDNYDIKDLGLFKLIAE